MAALVVVVAGLGGCATGRDPRDPIEDFNRAVFSFNDGLDKAVIRPVAKGYEAVLPAPARTGVTNFFGNIADVFISANNLLQGKVPEAAGDLGRFLINSTVGVLGLFDVASNIGLEKHDEDFGQTFGRWGVGDGFYVVLPVLGPHTSRDAVGELFDWSADPIGRLKRVDVRNSLVATRLTSDRAGILPADQLIDTAALDKYSYVRDAYLQRRRFKMYDGNPPREKDPDAALDVATKMATKESP